MSNIDPPIRTVEQAQLDAWRTTAFFMTLYADALCILWDKNLGKSPAPLPATITGKALANADGAILSLIAAGAIPAMPPVTMPRIGEVR